MTDVSTRQAESEMRTLFHTLLSRAVEAPSGDNSQPWRFSFDGDSLLLLNAPDADETLYNFRQHGSYVAHGAVIENLSLLAGEHGYALVTELFPHGNGITARLTLKPGEIRKTPLTAALERRATNRKPYRDESLTVDDRRAIVETLRQSVDVTLRLVENAEDRAHIAHTVSLNEQLLMENQDLHDFLFGMIRWSRTEEEKKPGLYVKTMELPVPVRFLFRYVVNHWALVRLLGVTGFSRVIRKQTGAVYGKSAAFGALVVRSEEPKDFIDIGRALERLWLTATVHGVSMQPVTALPYLGQRIRAGEAGVFSKKHQELIRAANDELARMFRLTDGEHIGFLFRLGYSDSPSAQSKKLPPIIL